MEDIIDIGIIFVKLVNYFELKGVILVLVCVLFDKVFCCVVFLKFLGLGKCYVGFEVNVIFFVYF